MQEVKPVQYGHEAVGENEVGPFPGRHFESLAAVPCFTDGPTMPLEVVADDLAIVARIIDQQHLHHYPLALATPGLLKKGRRTAYG